jgi:hypothetical protein
MRTILLIVSLLAGLLSTSRAQKVIEVAYESQADIKVYIVKYESQCDLKVYKVNYESQAKEDGKWYFVKFES